MVYHLCSPHSFCVVLFVWCTVVYAHGRTYIDVSFSCLYGVPLVYARGRTHIERALAWLRGVPFMFSTLIFFVLFVWCTVVYTHGRTYIDVSFSCLYGVPLVYALGHTRIDRAFTWCTIYVLHTHSVSSCLYGVPLCTHAVVLTLIGLWSGYDVYHLCSPHSFCVVLFVWCTVVYTHGRTYIDVSSCLYGVPLVYALGHTRIDRAFTWCTIYVLHTHSVSSCLYGVPLCTHTVVLTLTCPSLVCMVYR